VTDAELRDRLVTAGSAISDIVKALVERRESAPNGIHVWGTALLAAQAAVRATARARDEFESAIRRSRTWEDGP
jgi:hypothetical protein